MSRYKILTVNAKSLMWNATFNENKIPRYVIDLSLGNSKSTSSIAATEEMGNSPYFDQILMCAHKNINDDRPELLYNEVIFVELGDVLKYLNSENAKAELEDGIVRTDIIKGLSIVEHLKHMLSCDNGIHVIYPDGHDVHFIPGDSSASMKKAHKIAFINAVYKDELAKRICLGIDFSKIGLKTGGLQLSKYYAYRGLMLTTSTRINFTKKEVNPDTVIVIQDIKDVPIDADGCKFLTAKRKENLNGRHEFKTVKGKPTDLNVYDGEGLICPELADKINDHFEDLAELRFETEGLSAKYFKHLTSFQIRGPFLKGMVHTVDFNSFFKEYGIPDKNGQIIVTDVFGVKRNLLAAKIILTESMLKCAGWLKEYCTYMQNKDPLKYYFDNYYKYEHSLYIANEKNDDSYADDDDDILEESSIDESSYNGIEKLNYQFLSTLDLTDKELAALVSNHFRIGKERLKERYQYDYKIKGKGAVSTEPYILAAKYNPAFGRDELIKSFVKDELINLRLNCGRGKLYTTGEHRYLSSDLLAFMIDVLGKCNLRDSKISTLPIGYFYAPKKLECKQITGDASLLRNPSLSRNELAISTSFIPEKNSLYKKYGLDKLSELVMLPRASIIPSVLSGADQDGDEVFIYTDENIVNAIKRGAYDENGNRKLSIAMIPDEGKAYKPAPEEGHPDINLILDSANKTGQLSNMAVTFARAAYSEGNEKAKQHAAECTIAVGLEIDKAKHGMSPEKTIRYLERECKKLREGQKKDYFVDLKEKLSGIKAKECSVAKADNGDFYTLISGNYDYYPKTIKPLSEVKFTLDRLLSYYALYQEKAKDYDNLAVKEILAYSKYPKKTHPYHFDFEADKKWAEKLDVEKLNKTSDLMNAYSATLRLFNIYKRKTNLINETNYYGKTITHLQIRYDGDGLSYIPPYPGNKDSIEKLLDTSLMLIESSLIDYNKAKEALELLISSKWQFTIEQAEKEKIINKVLYGTDQSNIPDNIRLFLTDFNEEGYFLFYNLIKTVLYRYQMQASIDDMLKGISFKKSTKHKETNNSLSAESKTENKSNAEGLSTAIESEDPQDALDELRENPYGKDFIKILDCAIKEKYMSSLFRKKIINLCLRHLERIFPATGQKEFAAQALALSYVFKLYKGSNSKMPFLWDVIFGNGDIDINNYLYKKDDKQC